MTFATMHIKTNRFINKVSSAAFGVYLLHDSILLRSYLWTDVFHNARFQNTAAIIPYSLAVTLIVYVACTLIDWIRMSCFEKPFLKLVNPLINRLHRPVETLICQIRKVLFGKDDAQSEMRQK